MANITEGYVVRNVAGSGAFDNEELDDGRLVDASVNAIQGSKDVNAIMRGLERGHYNEYAVCDAKKIIQKGGTIRKVPIRGNANHCQIHGLKLKDANNLFSNHIDY